MYKLPSTRWQPLQHCIRRSFSEAAGSSSAPSGTPVLPVGAWIPRAYETKFVMDRRAYRNEVCLRVLHCSITISTAPVVIMIRAIRCTFQVTEYRKRYMAEHQVNCKAKEERLLAFKAAQQVRLVQLAAYKHCFNASFSF